MTTQDRAIELLKRHRDLIAREISSLIERVAPAFRDVDLTARRQSVAAHLEAFTQLLSGASKSQLMSHVEQTVRLRALAGVSPEAIFAASHCYLPVIRRVFVQQSRDPLEGLRAYEVVEAVALPLITRFGFVLRDVIEDAGEEVTAPEGLFRALLEDVT